MTMRVLQLKKSNKKYGNAPTRVQKETSWPAFERFSCFVTLHLLRSFCIGRLMPGRRPRSIRVFCMSSDLKTVRDDHDDRRIQYFVILPTSGLCFEMSLST